ncbi:MAG: hypothetical protein ACLFPQ_01555 [Candidatus Woesearchaeota archaeon]
MNDGITKEEMIRIENQKRKESELFDDYSDYPEEVTGDDEFNWYYYGEIDNHNYDKLIERCIEKRCFLESISLIHNSIELFLKNKLKEYYYTFFGLNEQGYEVERTTIEINPKMTIDEKKCALFLDHYFKGIVYLREWSKRALNLNLISNSVHENIISFNDGRKLAIHNLLSFRRLKSDSLEIGLSDRIGTSYTDLINISKNGFKILLTLRNYTPSEIETKLNLFNISDEEKEKDKFLNY